MRITESQLRSIVSEVLSSSLNESDLTRKIKKFVKSTYKEIVAPFQNVHESLIIVAALLIAIAAAPEILASLSAISIRAFLSAAFVAYDIWFSASLLTDSIFRAIPLIKAISDGNKKRAFEMSFMIVCNVTELALFRQMTAAGRPIKPTHIASAIDDEKFKSLGKLMKVIAGMTESLARSGALDSRISSRLMKFGKEATAGYAFLKLDMQKEDYAEAFSAALYPDEIDWDRFIEETVDMEAQVERSNADTRALVSQMVDEFMKQDSVK